MDLVSAFSVKSLKDDEIRIKGTEFLSQTQIV